MRPADPCPTFTPVERHGRTLLLALYVSLLAGRFSLGRLGSELDFDIRAVGAYALALACLLWMGVARWRTTQVAVGAYLGWFFGLCAWLTVTAWWAPAGARLSSRLADLGFLALFIGLAMMVASRLPDTGPVWRWTWIAGLVYFASAIAAGPGDQGRYAALGGGPNVFVRVMILAAIAALALAVLHGHSGPLWTLPIFGAGTVLSGSRGGLATLGVVIAVGALPLLRRTGRRLRRRLVLVSVLGGVGAAGLFGPRLASLWRERFITQTLIERYDAGRTTLLDQAWELFLEHPVVGAGLDGFHAIYPQWAHAHNLVLSIGAEAGILGLAPLGGAFLTVVVVTWRNRPISADALFMLLAGTAVLVASMFSGDFYDTRFMWFFFGLAIIEARRAACGHGHGSRQSRGALAASVHDSTSVRTSAVR
jgi:O-antigen ligase